MKLLDNKGLTKNHNDLISFVCDARVFQAVTYNEFRQFLYLLIAHNEDLPTYIFDLLDLEDQYSGSIIKTIPFHCSMKASDGYAIKGIAYKRGLTEEEPGTLSRKAALKALEQNPHIEDRFREVFPFIDY